MVLTALAIAMFLTLSFPIVLVRADGFAVWTAPRTAIAVRAAASLTCDSAQAQDPPQQKHSVVLRWKASSTKNVRYNIYRGSAPGVHRDKLNPAPVEQLTFTDTSVQSGKRYYYVVRAVDADGRESSDSDEALATIP